MSFGKSKVARFGDKPEIFQRSSATDIPSQSRESARSTQSAKNGIVSSSFTESSRDTISAPRTLAEATQKLRSAAKHGCLGSRIGRPNLKKNSIKNKSTKKADSDVHARDSYTTVDSSKSGTPSSRIPRSALGSRAGSFVVSSDKSQDFHKRSLEMNYNLKAKRFSSLKRELIEKQKPAIELYRALMSMRNKYQEMEGRNLPLEELKIIEYPEMRLMDEKQKEAEEEKLKDMKIKLNSSPTTFLDLCRQILDEKCGILDKIFDDEGEWSQDDLIRKIQNYKEQSALLEGRVEGRLKEEEGKMRELIKEWFLITKMRMNEIGSEKETVNAELESKLQETETKLKQTIADLQIERKKNKDLCDRNRELDKEFNKIKDKFNESNKVLEEERSKIISHKERQNVLEHKMKTAKLRMREAEIQKQDLEVRVDNLNELMKKHSEEWKSKEMYFEEKNKELQDAVRTHQQEVDKLAKERHSLDVRLSELQNDFQEKEYQYEDKIQQLEFEINEIKNQKANLENEYDLLRVQSVNSEIFSHMQQQNKKNICLDDDSPYKSATESALWQELKETRSALKLAEEKLAIYADEKTRFLNTINENFVDDTPANMTAVLMQKEQLISTLILQNKQLKKYLDETNEEFEAKRLRIKELEEKFQNINDQMFQSDIDTEKEIYDLHIKLQQEVEHNKELEEQLVKAHEDNKSVKEMLVDYENLLKIRDGLLNMMQEKKQATEEQNNNLKDYIVQMREQLNLLNFDKSSKEQELKTLSRLLEEKTGYIDKIEQRVAELEESVQELKNMRFSSISYPPQLAPEQSESPSKEHLQQFITHAQNLCTQEVIRFRKRLHSRIALQNLESTSTGLTKNSNRPLSAQSCLEHQRKTKTKIITTVSDIMKKYKSSEGFDLKYYPSSSTLSN